MLAAVVRSFDAPPRCEEYPTPVASEPEELLVDVLAAGLHPRVRSQAAGTHYSSTEQLPLVPGIDGIGRGVDGLLRYFVLADTPMGSMAEQAVIDVRRSVVLPDDSDPIAVAASMNPAMSSWVALRHRVDFEPGHDVLILGATGSAGRMAVQVARVFGARRIIAAGRNEERLAELAPLGATDVVTLGPDDADRLGDTGAEVDVVLDYLWGEPSATAMAALVRRRRERDRPLTWIEIGSVAGATAPVPSAALRATRLAIVGSGQGSVGARELVAELPALAAAISAGTFQVDAREMALADVEEAWLAAPLSSARIVITP